LKIEIKLSALSRRMVLLCGFLLCGVASLWAQSFELVGRVTDPSGNPVELASVVSQGKIALTSLKGEFRMDLREADSVEVTFSMVGYKTLRRVLKRPRGKQTLQVTMHESDIALGEVTVSGQRRQTDQTQELKREDMEGAVSASGNAVEDMVKMQAGVSSHDELSAQYNVRGGAFDENSVYINGIEVFRPFLVRSGQQEGLSIINPWMVEKIRFSTGGFPAKYGDKMSSALDIGYRTLRPAAGKKTATDVSFSASLLGGSANVGVATKRLSWLSSVRYKSARSLLGTLDTKGEYDPRFLDFQTYLVYSPNDRWRVDFIGSVSNNDYRFKPADRETSFGTLENVKAFKVYFDGEERDLFRTWFGSLGLRRQLGKESSVALQASGFKTREQERYDIQGQYWLTQTETSENLGVGTYFEHARNYLDATVGSLKLLAQHKAGGHELEGALTLKHEEIEERSVEYEMRDSSGYSVPHTGKDLQMIYSLRANNTLKANRVEFYAQDTWRFTSGGRTEDDGEGSGDDDVTLYTLTYGIRFAHWNFNKESILSPRVSLGIIPKWNHNVTLRFATGLYYQAPFYKELRDTSTVNGVTTATLNRNIKSQRSLHVIAGLDYRFDMGKRPFRFTAEAYWKALSRLIPYSVNNVKVVYYGDNVASGHAAGIDLKLYGEFVPGTDSWLSLSVMDAKMKLNGATIPLPTDQRFGVNMYFTDYFPGTDRWKMSLRLAYADGLPFAAPHQDLATGVFRAPAYKRVDLGMSCRLLGSDKAPRKNKTVKNIWLGLDCLNLLGINNVNSYYWITDVTNQQYAVPNYLTGRQLNVRLSAEL